ncbi:MAG: restriction endonuclease [Rhodanobacter sp.]
MSEYEAIAENDALEHRMGELAGLLRAGLREPRYPAFESLRKDPVAPALDLGHIPPELAEPRLHDFELTAPWTIFRWIPLVRTWHERRQAEAYGRFDEACRQCQQSNRERQVMLETARSDHGAAIEQAHREAEERNQFLLRAQEYLRQGAPTFCDSHYAHVLSTQKFPERFDLTYKAAYAKESRQVVVEVDLPPMQAVIPAVKAYKYVKRSDSVTQTPRPERERKVLYAQVIAQIVLRSLSRLFTADYLGVVDSVVLNGIVEAINPGTGRSARSCIISVRTTLDAFTEIDLLLADPVAALQTLKASFSRDPAEMVPVRPILEFSMVDPRFINEGQVLAGLDQRANLMDLTPGEFESLITNLFTQMGLETRQTQASRDGGVDCVAYDPRPIFGGKVVIQAKRYKDTVGVSAVRDLFGTMQNEGASKGILVTTSGYGKAAFDFAAGKPLELLDGANLLALLLDHAGLDARIVMPS